jgi:hypothetical protein
MTDYVLTLQFVKHKTTDQTVTLLTQLLDYVKQMFMMIGLKIFPSTTPETNYINNEF